MPADLVFPVLEVFAHNHWEPWAIILQPSDAAYLRAAYEAKWQLQPLRYRISNTEHWGGIQACYNRMEKVFNHRNN
jgi:hypothetical protein